MTKMVQLRALRPFPYGKHRLAVGEVFDVSEKLAPVFIKEGRAAAPDTPSPVDLPAEVMSRASKREPVTEEVEDKSAAPLYRTRHMEAKRPGEAAVPEAAPPPKKRGRPAGKGRQSQ